MRLPAVLLALLAATASPAQEPAPNVAEAGLKEVAIGELSSPSPNAPGQAALAVRREAWKHAETENFIYHFRDPAAAKQVAIEAEFYFRVIARDLRKAGERGSGKARIFIFDGPGDWDAFRRAVKLDPWTGGAYVGNELFVKREGDKFQGASLGHEVAHLVLHRFFGDRIPLWLNEGYAEHISRVLYAAFYRARGYRAKPRFAVLTAEDFLPLERLASATSYPTAEREVLAFYIEAQKLVSYLKAQSADQFAQFLAEGARGSSFDSALNSAFGGRFNSRSDLETQFKVEALKKTEGE